MKWTPFYVFRWGIHLYMPFFPSICPSVCPLRIMSQESYMMWDNNFWCICVKYLQDFFSFFQNLYSLGCYGGKSSKNSPKWKKKKNYICHVPYLRNSIVYDHDFWYTCVKWWYLLMIFSFFQILIFLFVRGGGGVKVQEMANMTINPVCHIPCLRDHTSYDSHLW